MSRKGHVLVIDDEPNVAKLLRRILGSEFDTVVVSSAESALQLLEDEPFFDAILCDVNLGGLSGPGLRDGLRQLAPGLVPRLIFMTGNRTSAMSEALKGHVIIEKPFDPAFVRVFIRSRVEAAMADEISHGCGR